MKEARWLWLSIRLSCDRGQLCKMWFVLSAVAQRRFLVLDHDVRIDDSQANRIDEVLLSE